MDGTLPAGTSVGRVGLRVANLDGVADFYRSVVGLETVEDHEDGVVLGAGGDPLLVLDRAVGVPARTGTEAGLFHTAVRVPDRGALGDALARIDDDWRLVGASNHRVSEALYLQDPEDNGVELYCDLPREQWPTADGRVQMDTLLLPLADLRAAATGADALPAGTDVGHVHLEVTDLDAARDFYVDAVGLGVRLEWDSALFVAAGDYHHHVGLNVWNGRSAPAEGRGLDWVELRVPGADAIDAARQRLVDAGYDVRGLDADQSGVAVDDPDDVELRLRPA